MSEKLRDTEALEGALFDAQQVQDLGDLLTRWQPTAEQVPGFEVAMDDAVAMDLGPGLRGVGAARRFGALEHKRNCRKPASDPPIL